MENTYIILFILYIIFLIIVLYTNYKRYTEAFDFYDKYGYKQMVYKEMLIKTKKALNELKIPFFLSSGTCLGYYREGKFIDHDYDIDIGIFAKDYTTKIIDKMEKHGMKLYRILGNKRDGMELSFQLDDTSLGKYAKVDIFLHYFNKDSNGDKIYWISYRYPKFEKKIKYQVSKFNLKPVKFLGVKVSVPDPTLRYIEEHYGNDWYIPKKQGVDYFYASSPKSIVK